MCFDWNVKCILRLYLKDGIPPWKLQSTNDGQAHLQHIGHPSLVTDKITSLQNPVNSGHLGAYKTFKNIPEHFSNVVLNLTSYEGSVVFFFNKAVIRTSVQNLSHSHLHVF